MFGVTISGMLRRVMVVVLLGCVGLTAGVALGTVFFGHEVPSISVPAHLLLPQSNCHQDWRWPPDLAAHRSPHHHLASSSSFRCHVKSPAIITYSAPSARLPLRDYVLFGLLAGLSAALGFLVPPRSLLNRR